MRLDTGNFVGRNTRFVHARQDLGRLGSADGVPAWVGMPAPDGAALIDLQDIDACAGDVALSGLTQFDEGCWRARLDQLASEVPRTDGVAMRFLEDLTALIVKALALIPPAHTQRALEIAEEKWSIYFWRDDEGVVWHDEARELAWRLRLRELARQVPGCGGARTKGASTMGGPPAGIDQRRDVAAIREPAFDDAGWRRRLSALAGQIPGCGGVPELFADRFSALVDVELSAMSERHAQRAREIALRESDYYDRAAHAHESREGLCVHFLDADTCPCGCFE